MGEIRGREAQKQSRKKIITKGIVWRLGEGKEGSIMLLETARNGCRKRTKKSGGTTIRGKSRRKETGKTQKRSFEGLGWKNITWGEKKNGKGLRESRLKAN